MVKNMKRIRQNFSKEITLTFKANLFNSGAVRITISPFSSFIKDGLKA